MPILPVRSKSGKLIFALCGTCAENEATTPYCSHSDNERALHHQVYCTPELHLALKNNYKLLDIDEIWHWDTRSDELFRDFIAKWMKLKISSSGFPSNIESGDDVGRQAYIDKQNEFYGIDLRVADVGKNSTMRTLAKQNVNMFWGRFGLNMDVTKKRLITTTEDYIKMVTDPSISINYVKDINDNVILVNYRTTTDFIPIEKNLSLIISLFTTCWARLHLYSALSKLHPSQILYYDTDSIIWVRKNGFPTLETGDMVGEFKDEIEDSMGPGVYIKTFFSSGPKSYGYVTTSDDGDGHTKAEAKVKGIPLSTHTLEQLNAEKMLDAITALDGRQIKINIPRKITRDLKTVTLYNKDMIKTWKIVYNKRVLVNNYCTLPFGYFDE